MFEDIIGDVASDANQLIADVKAWQAQINAAGISATINTSAPQAATAGSATVTSAISAVNAAGQAATAAGQNAMSIAQQAQMNPTLQQQLAQSMIMLPNGTPLNAMTLMQVAQAATTAGQQASALGQSGAALASGADATSWLAQANTATSNANTAATNANNASQQLQMLMTSSAPYTDAGYGGGSYGGGGGGFGGGGGDFGGGGGGGDDSGVDWGDDSGQGGQEDDYAAAQSMLDDVAAQTGDYGDDSGDLGSDMSDLDMSDFGSSDLFAPMVVGKQAHPSVVLGAAFAEARGKRLYQHVLGIDVEAVKQRFDELDPTNNNVKSMWLDNGHGLALAQRLDSDAQKILNTAVLPTNEFQFHDAILAFGKRALALSDKVQALPRDDNKSPLWEEVRSYFIDGSNLANQVEGVADGSLKWSDVKDSVVSMAHGIEQGGERVGNAIQWSTYAIVGGAVVLGGGILYALYKAITSDTGKAVAVTATRAAMLR